MFRTLYGKLAVAFTLLVAGLLVTQIAVTMGATRSYEEEASQRLYRDVADPNTLVSSITAAALQDMIERGEVSGGMIPKLEACIHAVEHGVTSAHMVLGTVPHVLLLELFTDAGIGTMVTGGRDARE